MSITRRKALSMLTTAPVLVGAQKSFAKNLLRLGLSESEQNVPEAGQ